MVEQWIQQIVGELGANGILILVLVYVLHCGIAKGTCGLEKINKQMSILIEEIRKASTLLHRIKNGQNIRGPNDTSRVVG